MMMTVLMMITVLARKDEDGPPSRATAAWTYVKNL